MNIIILAVICLIALALLQFSSHIAFFIRRLISGQRGSVQSEGNRLNDILKYEAENNFSREVVTLASGQNLSVGAVLGKKTKGACPTTGEAVSGSTGGGTCTSVTAGLKAKVGIYMLTCISKVAGAGIFTVADPDGYALPNAIAGVAYTNDQINFTINDGSPDFEVGDAFTIEIEEGDGDVAEIDFDALDGSADAYGILTADADASDGDLEAVAIVRDARIVTDNLVWPTTSPAVTDAQKAAALAQLKEKNIDAVSEV